MSQEEIRSLDADIIRLQQSTRTLFPSFTRTHNWLRMKSRSYYRWHMNRFHTAVHLFVLLTYVLGTTTISYSLVTDIRPAQATSAPTIYDMATTSNYQVRLDGAAAGDGLGMAGFVTGDINGNGKKDIVVGATGTDHNFTNASSLYLIYDFEDIGYTGTGNVHDFSDATKYHIRFDGPQATPLSIGEISTPLAMGDYNGDGKEDIIIAYSFTNVNGTNSGSLFFLSNELITSFTGTGNNLNMSNSSNYTVRIDGKAAGDVVAYQNTMDKPADLDGDGKNDLLLNAPGLDYNGSTTGSIFLISSTILDDYTGTGNSLDITDSSKFSIRWDGEASSWAMGAGYFRAVDINGNGRNDLVVGSSLARPYGRGTAGSTYIIYDDLIRSYSGTGNTVNLSSAGTYSLRIDGATASDVLSRYTVKTEDLDNDGKLDLILGAHGTDYNSRTNSGSIYVLYGTLLDDYSGTGSTLDLATSSNYNIRIDGAATEDTLGYSGASVIDFDNDGKNELLLSIHKADNNSRTDSGSVYLIDDTVIASYTGTGNQLDMSDTSKYQFRWDGAVAGDRMLVSNRNYEDINGDAIDDLYFISYFTDNNSRTDSGSIYLWFNFPHTITAPSVEGDSSSADRTIKGTITATSSITNISNVQASINTSSFSGTWIDCTAVDGAFDSKSESYSCSLALPSEGTHTIRVRAKDSNGVYTPVSRYRASTTTYSIPVAASPSPTSVPTPTPSSAITSAPADTTPPSVSLQSITGTTFRSSMKRFIYTSSRPRPIFAGTAEVGAKVTVSVDKTTLCEATADKSGNWQCTTDTLNYQEYAVAISATDEAGNKTFLPSFTLDVKQPTAEATPATSDTSSQTPTASIPTMTPSKSTAPSVEPYVATVVKAGETYQLSEFKMRILDRRGNPVVNALVTLYSEPKEAITDENGVATFTNVPVGEHELVYSHRGALIKLPVSVALANTVREQAETGAPVQVTIAPVEVYLPVAHFGLISVLWLVIVAAIAAIGGYLGYRHAEKLFPQWKLVTNHRKVDTQAFDTEIDLIQQSTRTTWPIFTRLHNWLRMHVKVYYWWHLLPHRRVWLAAAIIIYLLIVLILGYSIWRT